MAATGLTAQVIGRSVRGASHVRTGRTNQDAIAWSTATADGLVIAVADGHGSDKSFRSERGSRLAVAIAVAVLASQLRRPGAPTWAGPDITARWVHEVRADLAARPLSTDDLAGLDARERAHLAANPLLAYGTTVLAVAVTPGGVNYLQLGDGDIVFVARDGSAWVPLPEDSRNAGNQTLSLCLPGAARDFRYGTAALDEAPRMILLSSDGFANSYQNEAAFLKFGTDLLAMIDDRGITEVEPHLQGWLQETTEHGAGDDVTLAVVLLDLPRGVGRATAPSSSSHLAPTVPLEAVPVDGPRKLSYPPATLGPTQKGEGAVRGARGGNGRKRQSGSVAVPAPRAASGAPGAVPGAVPGAGAAPGRTDDELRRTDDELRRRSSRRLVTGMLAAAAVVILAVLAFVFLRGGGDNDQPPPGPVTPTAAQTRRTASSVAVAPLLRPGAELPVVQRCGDGFCLLDNDGALWFSGPGGTGWQRSRSTPGWTRMTIDGADVQLSRDRDAAVERVPIPGGGGPPTGSGPGGGTGGAVRDTGDDQRRPA